MSAPLVNLDVLLSVLLPFAWQRECSVVVGYMPLFPGKNTRPSVVVRWESGERSLFLRHSMGPRQGFFWDIYGDDMMTAELPLVALSKAPDPNGMHWHVDRTPLPVADVVRCSLPEARVHEREEG